MTAIPKVTHTVTVSLDTEKLIKKAREKNISIRELVEEGLKAFKIKGE